MTKTAYIDFKAVRAAMEFPTVLSHYGIKTEGTGDQLKIICPFHDDHKPSCGVNTAKGVYNCFSCGAHGNVMEFVTHMEDEDPDTTSGIRKGALAALAIMNLDDADFRNAGGNSRKPEKKTKAGKKPKGEKKAKKATKTEKPEPEEKQEGPINPPLSFELDLKNDHPFFEERDISPETVERFGLGYCNKGIMSGRICIPLHNANGELVAYAGRYAAEDLPQETPRYKLPKGFQKAHVLFNLHRLIEQSPKHLVIVEGFWSVIRLDTEGIAAVAVMGTALTDEQLEQIVETGIRHATVIFDGDEGGQAGAEEAVKKLSRHLYVRQLVLPDGIKPDTMPDEYLDRLR